MQTKSEWNSFEYLPFEKYEVQEPSKCHFETSTANDIESFFSSFSSQLIELNLSEKNTDILIKLFIKAIENVNQLNEILISDSNGLTTSQV